MERAAQPRGFTLIEVLIVMVIITILAGISLALYNNNVIRARETVLATNLRDMREAIDQYYADKNQYPASLETLVTDRYIRAVPVDPITQVADWRTEYADPDPSNPSAPPGIGDVRSASDQVSPLTGTPYAEW
jgi:general secretion pathway protein G